MAAGFFLAFLALVFALIKYIYQKNVANKVEGAAVVVNAVINHGKDTVNSYVEKHQTINEQQSISNTVITENDEMYAVAMNEIESGTVQKGLYARAFSQSEGDKNKTDALYIKFRVQTMKDETRKNASSSHSDILTAKVISTVNQDLEKNIKADKRAKEADEELKMLREKEYLKQQQIKEEQLQREKLLSNSIPKKIKKKIENDGYMFLSTSIVRDKSTWNDYDFFAESDRIVFKNRENGQIVKEYISDANNHIFSESVAMDETDKRINEIQQALDEYKIRSI